ncbi:glycosyltransferase [Paenibacillus senegalensis]|uniref:glycosyltransferase n=1 Tax=Paenibacillus senegalensis TaxID=1465766 RepID=UPI000287AA64|nr:glycosyltransferase [Paenibacillus senegalensis]
MKSLMKKVKSSMFQNSILRWIADSSITAAKKMLSEEQKEFIKRQLSVRQKELLKRMAADGRHSINEEIHQIKYKLLNLGFLDAAYSELQKLSEDNKNQYRKQVASWELAIWHADKKTINDAKISMSYLRNIVVDKKTKADKDLLRQIELIKAENLWLLGEHKQAAVIIGDLLGKDQHPDVYMARSNTENELDKKLFWINKIMNRFNLTEIKLEANQGSLFDSLFATESPKQDGPKVTVIMPAYNSERVINTSLTSILNQTWVNLEVIVVDDCSTDNTVGVIQSYMQKDTRIRLIQCDKNRGAYYARNLGLQIATGDYVTCHDADDWSHPQKIEKQVQHLIGNRSVIANTSEQSRVTENLNFHRKPQHRVYLFPNMSSLMFRREDVLNSVGYWDSVRFGADGEFVRRVKAVFGSKSVVNISSEGPLSFTRVSANSLTESNKYGYPGFLFGARKEYFESFSNHHASGKILKIGFPMANRPFPIPHPMNSENVDESRHFDVIIASDFRLTGGTTSSNVEEIKAQLSAGLKTGLIQMSRYRGLGNKPINPKIRELIDGKQVQMIVYGEKVSCDVLIIRHPPVLQDKQMYIPEVTAKTINVIVNQTPRIDYGVTGALVYDMEECEKNLTDYFKKKSVWYPIAPQIRKTLVDYHSDELSSIQLASEDWVNIINVDEWKRTNYVPNANRIVIGRHSRDQYVKWPSEPDELLAIYPDSSEFEVRVLGGAKIPENILGKLPRNWKVWEFGSKTPKEFLSELDVFVYYVHPDCVEAFGRVIIEAMAVGVPVVLPHSYYDLFGEAAIYAESIDVKQKVIELISNNSAYDDQVTKATEFINNKFSYARHISRIREY